MLFQAALKDMAYSFSPLAISSRIRISLFLIPPFLYEERMASVAIHHHPLFQQITETRNNFYVHYAFF